MGIAQKVSRNFSDAVRSRGQSYFSKGRVTLISTRPNEIVSRVRGTAKYRVRVRLRGMKLLASCSCPYFSPQGEPCKHLWATLLLADARGFLQTAPNVAVRLIVEPGRRGTWTGPRRAPSRNAGTRRGPRAARGPLPGPSVRPAHGYGGRAAPPRGGSSAQGPPPQGSTSRPAGHGQSAAGQ